MERLTHGWPIDGQINATIAKYEQSVDSSRQYVLAATQKADALKYEISDDILYCSKRSSEDD